MFDFVMEFIFETVGDFVSDLFDGAAEGTVDAASAAVEGQDVLGAAAETTTGIEPPIVGDGSSLAALDGGISADSFDPKPPMGPYSP